MDIHIGNQRTECVVPAGYLNRKARRRIKKLFRAKRQNVTNKINKLTDKAADITASIIAAPFRFTGKVLGKLFWWV